MRTGLNTNKDNGAPSTSNHDALAVLRDAFFGSQWLPFGLRTTMSTITLAAELLRNNPETRTEGDTLLRTVETQNNILSRLLALAAASLTNGAAHQTSTTAPSSTTLANLSVLVIEDDPDLLELTIRVLEDAGASALPALSAADAFTVLSTSPRIDVIVSDIGLPGMDGYAFMRELRQSRNIPALAVTAYGEPEDRRRALSAGFVDHIPKPYDPDTLVARVRHATSHPPAGQRP